MLNRIGLPATLYYFLLYLLVIALSIITEKPKKIVLQYLQHPLLETACQYLLLLVGINILIYRKCCDRSPILVGHQDHFLAPLPGSEALLVAELVRTFSL